MREDEFGDNGDRNEKWKSNVVSMNLLVLGFVVKCEKKKRINY